MKGESNWSTHKKLPSLIKVNQKVCKLQSTLQDANKILFDVHNFWKILHKYFCKNLFKTLQVLPAVTTLFSEFLLVRLCFWIFAELYLVDIYLSFPKETLLAVLSSITVTALYQERFSRSFPVTSKAAIYRKNCKAASK